MSQYTLKREYSIGNTVWGHARNTDRRVPQATAWLGTVTHSLRGTFRHATEYLCEVLGDKAMIDVTPVAALCTLPTLISKPSCPVRGARCSHAPDKFAGLGAITSLPFPRPKRNLTSRLECWVWKAV